MPGLLADINVQGQVAVLRSILESAAWRAMWIALAVPIRTFADVGLPPDAADAVIWQVCQQHQLILLTANRNKARADSLEATIQNANTLDSLPVFTLANAERIRHSKAHAERVVERLLEYLLDIEQLRGTGRLYLP